MSEPNPLAQEPNREPIAPTEAQKELGTKVRYALPGIGDQLIADSEARALASLAMVAAESADRNVSLRLENDQLRAEVERVDAFYRRACEMEHEMRAELAGEVERLTNACNSFSNDEILQGSWKARAERAEASLHALRLICGTTDADKFTTWVDRANARAERAEAELATERARLDWLEFRGPWEAWSEPCGEAEITLRGPIRAAIDAAAMQEGA